MVSIIIVNYNTEQLLDDCIASVIAKTKGVCYEIIVVDNDSQKGSLSAIALKYPEVTIVYSDKNLGFGVANNLGVQSAKGKYLFLLNPDTLLINDAVTILYNYMEENRNTGICGGNMYKGDMTPTASFHVLDFMTREYKILFNRKREEGFNNTGIPMAVNVIIGADLMISKSLFEQMQGFDPDFFMYFEEVELCDRVRKAGYKVISVPDAEIIHLQGSAAENKSEDLNKWSYQEHWYSKQIYFYKTKGELRTATVYHISMLKLKLATLLSSLKSDSEKFDYWKAKEAVMLKTRKRYKEYIKTHRH